MTHSIKQARYSGVKDGNTWRNQAHTLAQADSHDETRDIPVGLGTFSSTVLRIWAGPTHTQVQITLIIMPQFHHRISYLKVDSHCFFKSCVSSLMSNHWKSSVTIHRLWPQLTLIPTENLLEVQYSSKNYVAALSVILEWGAQDQAISKRCPLPLWTICTSFFPHHCPSSQIFLKKT